MKLMHLASFGGNIGDGANHRGMYRQFKNYVDPAAQFEQCEVRRFYKSWSLDRFDSNFVDEVNRHDALLIGGGNFFEICWDYSQTGCTIDFSQEVLDTIRIPILVAGIGFDDTKGFTSETESRFGAFLENLLRKKAKIVFRNDGSLTLLRRHYDDSLLSRVSEMPDGGFFYEIPARRSSLGKRICFCVARDMANLRYTGEDGYDRFVRKMGSWCDGFIESHPEYSIVFVPHIYSDLSIIDDVLKSISDINRRLKVAVAPLCAVSPDAIDGTFSSYSGCDLVVSMRFHGNVVPIGNDIPTIGAVSLEKHQLLYQSIGLGDRFISTTSSEFWETLTESIERSLADQTRIRNEYAEINKSLREREKDAMLEIKKWLADWSAL